MLASGRDARHSSKTNLWACRGLGSSRHAPSSHFLPAGQPYISTRRGLSAGDLGRITGYLQIAADGRADPQLDLYGALADRIGRRPCCVAGLLLVRGGGGALPFAGNAAVLVAPRVLFASASPPLHVTMSAITADYVRDRTRGRAYGWLGLFSGIGAVIAVLVLVRLPSMLEQGGMEPIAAARDRLPDRRRAGSWSAPWHCASRFTELGRDRDAQGCR
ncbi:MFS transporter [Nonomuraea dietziae]|uniref:MFS transporter n=1 Tax=Nonomuraea dietziae TaxID=65515 RepID=UPI0031DEC6AC